MLLLVLKAHFKLKELLALITAHFSSFLHFMTYSPEKSF